VQIHGHPGDYAWGTGGLDAIITQVHFYLKVKKNSENAENVRKNTDRLSNKYLLSNVDTLKFLHNPIFFPLFEYS